jgi:hypothetical protein
MYRLSEPSVLKRNSDEISNHGFRENWLIAAVAAFPTEG